MERRTNSRTLTQDIKLGKEKIIFGLHFLGVSQSYLLFLFALFLQSFVGSLHRLVHKIYGQKESVLVYTRYQE